MPQVPWSGELPGGAPLPPVPKHSFRQLLPGVHGAPSGFLGAHMPVVKSQYAVLEHATSPILAQGPESEGATQVPARQYAPSTQEPVLAQESLTHLLGAGSPSTSSRISQCPGADLTPIFPGWTPPGTDTVAWRSRAVRSFRHGIAFARLPIRPAFLPGAPHRLFGPRLGRSSCTTAWTA